MLNFFTYIYVQFFYHWCNYRIVIQTTFFACSYAIPTIYRVYQNYWSGLEVDYIHKYGEETYKY